MACEEITGRDYVTPDEAVALGDGERRAILEGGRNDDARMPAFALTGEASNAVQSIASAMPFFRLTGASVLLPLFNALLGSRASGSRTSRRRLALY